MPVEVIMPRVDMTMERGTILAWKVREGEEVREGGLLFEMDTDKATMEVESPTSGRLGRILVQAGVEVPVGTVVAEIVGLDEALGASPSGSAAPASRPAGEGQPVAPALVTSPRAPVAPQSSLGPGGKVRATPLARRLARLHGLDLSFARGTGPRGRIGRVDVDRLLASLHQVPSGAVAASAPEAQRPGKRVPFSATRKLIAQRMLHSVQSAPHFYMSATLDMSAVLALKERVSEQLKRTAGTKASVSAILVWLIAPLLRQHPYLNASVENDGVQLHEAVHIGIAMDRDGDLLVPVIRNAETLRLAGVVSEIERLRVAAAKRTITPADLRGSTFTLSNLGMYGVDSFTAIINPPETGILAVGRTVDTPVGRDGQLVLRPMATVTLSADHRAVDGVAAARFMRDLRTVVEAPEAAL